MTQTVLLGDVADINSESVSKRYPFSQILYLDTSSVTENTFSELQPFSIKDAPSRAKRIVRDGDIVYSTVRPNLKHFGYIQDPAENTVASTGFAVIRANDSADSRYLYYWIASDERTRYLTSIADSQTSTFPAFNPSILGKLKIKLPDLKTQKKIADILGTIDEKIELNRKMNETLEQMGQALFRHYFIDNPEAEKWEDDYINTQVDIKYGKNLPTKNLKDEGYPVFGGNGQIGYYEKYIYERPMVLVACRGAASGDINISKPKSFVTNNSLALEISSDSNFTFEYLRFYSYCRKNGYHEFVSGSAQPQITVESLSKCRIPIPSRELIGSFTEQARHLVERMLASEEQIQTLTTLRDTLLPWLISGKVKA